MTEIPDPLIGQRTALPALREALADWDAEDEVAVAPGCVDGSALAEAARELIAVLDAAGIDPASITSSTVTPEALTAAREASMLPVTVTDASGRPDTRPWVVGPGLIAQSPEDASPSKVLRCMVCKTPNEVPSSVDTVTCWACGKTSQPLAGVIVPEPDQDDVPRET